MSASSIAALLAIAEQADRGPDALRSARAAMQLLDPNGTWDPTACRADGAPLAGAAEILSTVSQWREDLAAI